MMPFQMPYLGGEPFGKNQGGRPKKVGQPIVLQDPGMPDGFQFTGGNPGAIKSAEEKYFSGGKNTGLPTGLAPKRLGLPQPIEQRRRQSISKGWAKRGKA